MVTQFSAHFLCFDCLRDNLFQKFSQLSSPENGVILKGKNKKAKDVKVLYVHVHFENVKYED